MFSLVFAFVFIGAGHESLHLDERDAWVESKAESVYPANAKLLTLQIVIGGLIVGGTVALMHYCESMSQNTRAVNEFLTTDNFQLPHFRPCLSENMIWLILSFRLYWHVLLRPSRCSFSSAQWHTNWWKKMICLAGLAAGVSGMHFCVISFIIVFSDFLVTHESRRKARRVTIVSATFDKSGQIL
ncbi:hypothetical protein MJO29_009702, partial [Puccinia striiformis f. sp. tritici]